MGVYGASIVVPTAVPTGCTAVGSIPAHYVAPGNSAEADYRLAASAYDNPRSCYDREYLFQFSEMDPRIHKNALAQVTARTGCAATSPTCHLDVPTEPYHPAYFMINGRSMPDDMDPNYAREYPHQPYNGNPHMHPGEQVLLRIIGQGRWQHPFHEHGNHVRILGRDGNLILSSTTAGEVNLAGPLLFTTTTTPGLAMDGIFYWTGKGLNWDPYGHNPASSDLTAKLPCTPDANGRRSGIVAVWIPVQSLTRPIENPVHGQSRSRCRGEEQRPGEIDFTGSGRAQNQVSITPQNADVVAVLVERMLPPALAYNAQ